MRTQEKKVNLKKEYAKKYLLKYINELKVHFNLDEDEIKEILRTLYYVKSIPYHIIKRIKRIFNR